MPQNLSLADMTAEEAAGMLARRASVVHRVKSAGLLRTKSANPVMDALKGWGGSVGSAIGQSPEVGNDLVGAGLGAAAGGLGGYAMGARRKSDDPDAPSPWSTALTGAIGGAGVGGGAALLSQHLPQVGEANAATKYQQAVDSADKSLKNSQVSDLYKKVLGGISYVAGDGGGDFSPDWNHAGRNLGWAAGGLNALKTMKQTASARISNSEKIVDPNLFRKIVSKTGDQADFLKKYPALAGLADKARSVNPEIGSPANTNYYLRSGLRTAIKTDAGASQWEQALQDYAAAAKTKGEGGVLGGTGWRAKGVRSLLPFAEQEIETNPGGGKLGRIAGGLTSLAMPVAGSLLDRGIRYVGDKAEGLPSGGDGAPLFGQEHADYLKALANDIQVKQNKPPGVQ